MIPMTVSIWAGASTGIDTTGTGVQMAVRLRLKNRDAGVYVPVPTDWTVICDGKTYTSDGDSLTVPLAGSKMETTAGLEIGMKQNSLPAGGYQWEIHLTSSALSDYPGTLTDTPLYLNFSLTDKQYSIKADFKNSTASRLYPAETADPRQPVQLHVVAKADHGATTDGVKQRVSLWKKDSSTKDYVNVNLDTLYINAAGLNQISDWADETDYDFTLKPSLPEGTYRLHFELVQTAGGVERVLTSDIESFIVTPQ